MTRQVLDEYLDGMLSPDQKAEVEAALRTDVTGAARLAKMKRERALRSAAMGSYAPSTEEAESAAVRVIAAIQDEAAAPVARIGPWIWMKRAGSIAAVLALVAGAFAAGRATAPLQTVKEYVEGPAKTATAYTVLYSESGETKTQAFDSELAAQAFMADRIQQAAPQNRQAVASIDPQGEW